MWKVISPQSGKNFYCEEETSQGGDLTAIRQFTSTEALLRSEVKQHGCRSGREFWLRRQDTNEYFQGAFKFDGMTPGKHKKREGILFCSLQFRVCGQLKVEERFYSTFFSTITGSVASCCAAVEWKTTIVQ